MTGRPDLLLPRPDLALHPARAFQRLRRQIARRGALSDVWAVRLRALFFLVDGRAWIAEAPVVGRWRGDLRVQHVVSCQ